MLSISLSSLKTLSLQESEACRYVRPFGIKKGTDGAKSGSDAGYKRPGFHLRVQFIKKVFRKVKVRDLSRPLVMSEHENHIKAFL